MLIHSASQLLTIPGPPQRGKALGELGIIPDGAVLIRAGEIAAIGPSAELLATYPDEAPFNATGQVVMPGFVDPHTHLVWAGERAAEFEMRLQGKTYLEIMAAGGGIVSTVRQTRQASLEQLVAEARPRLAHMFAHGTTTAEAKGGYGLETATEIKLLEAILQLDLEGPIDLVPTFLGAHAIPAEYKEDPQAYTDLVCDEMLPALQTWWQARAGDERLTIRQSRLPAPSVDVFCETGAFDLAQSRQILAKAQALGFPLKIHADEFDNL
ncbi:MAG: imidazolonepropionase, partial [Anaerolineales bacterium]|nr:imidazolonepropionase [Anaerolineales bacterium]